MNKSWCQVHGVAVNLPNYDRMLQGQPQSEQNKETDSAFLIVTPKFITTWFSLVTWV